MPFEKQPSIWKFTRPAEANCEIPQETSGQKDAVNHPSHYNSHPSGIEAITITSGFDFVTGNVIKYCWRAGLKSANPLEDLRKARWYLDYRIKQLETELENAHGRGGLPGDQSSH